MNAVLVSILMTSYNREKYIAESIESVLASSFTDFELIIVDDGSTDGTVAIARSYAEKDSRIQVYVNEKNLGDYENRNRAASYARGKYIKYLDSDDVFYPWGLQAMVYCMEESSGAALGLAIHNFVHKKFPFMLEPEEAYKLYFFKNLVLTIGPTDAIIRRDVFEEVKGFSGRKYIGDNELWLKITQKNVLACMPLNLVFWRIHHDQQIVQERKDNEIEAIRHALHLHFLESADCPLSKEIAAMAITNMKNIKCRTVIRTFLRGDFSEASRKKKMFKLNTTDFLRSFKKNEVPRIKIFEDGYQKI